VNGTVHRRSAAVGLVAALFSLSGSSTLPGALLVDLLGEVGPGPAAARRLLARMREQGQIESRRRPGPRGVDYALVDPFAASAKALQTWHEDPGGRWSGHFHALLHRIPEADRAYRDRFRRAAVLVGYAPLQPGVLVAVDDRADRVAVVLADLPHGARVLPSTLAMGRAEAAAAAREAWELDALGGDLTAHLAALRSAASDPDPAADAATLRRLTDLTTEVYVDLVRDPGLPPELRPPDWPGDALRAELGRLAATHGPAATAYLQARLVAHDGQAEADH